MLQFMNHITDNPEWFIQVHGLLAAILTISLNFVLGD